MTKAFNSLLTQKEFMNPEERLFQDREIRICVKRLLPYDEVRLFLHTLRPENYELVAERTEAGIRQGIERVLGESSVYRAPPEAIEQICFGTHIPRAVEEHVGTLSFIPKPISPYADHARQTYATFVTNESRERFERLTQSQDAHA